MQLSFYILESGKLPEGIKATLARVIPTLAGKKVKLELVEADDKRTLSQNAFYWTAIIPSIRDYLMREGETKHLSDDYIHYKILLPTYAPRFTAEGLDKVEREGIITSSQMTKKQFSEYILKIEADMCNFNITLPSHPKYD